MVARAGAGWEQGIVGRRGSSLAPNYLADACLSRVVPFIRLFGLLHLGAVLLVRQVIWQGLLTLMFVNCACKAGIYRGHSKNEACTTKLSLVLELN